jgi:thiol-disulfide isomerase/thioredoxin
MIAPLFVLALVFPSDGPFADLTFDVALATAAKEDKVVFVDFFTTWCGPCKKLDSTTWVDADVVSWLRANTVPIKVDAEEEAELAARYRVAAYPTLLFVGPDGEERGRLVGYHDAAGFLETAPQRLAGHTALEEIEARLAESPDDMSLRMDLGDELARAGRYDEALEEYLHCFDEGADAPGFGGVRLSYLLSSLVRLGGVCPRALDALVERAEASERRLREGGDPVDAGDAGDARDMAALNEALGRDARTLEVYDALRAVDGTDPSVLDGMYRSVIDLLMESERYADVLDGAGDVMKRIGQQIQILRMTEARFADADPEASPVEYMRRSTVADIQRFFVAYLGVGELERAWKVAKRILEVDTSPETFAGLLRASRDAEGWTVSRDLAERARAELPEEELEPLRRELDRIPAEPEPGSGRAGSGR